MAITEADLKVYQSERMTDEDDGGGQMTATVIDGSAENQIFDDLSDVDRAAGDVSIRKVYASITSADTDKYLDAGVIVFRKPADPNVDVLIMSTADFYDERAAIQAKLEQTVTRSARYNGWLYGQHYAGMRAILIWQRPAAEIVSVGARVELVARVSGVEQYSEFVWITRVTSEQRTMYVTSGDNLIQYLVTVLTCEISEALAHDYQGLEPTRADPDVSSSTALIYSTRYNPDSVPLHSIQPLAAAAALGDYSIKVASLYAKVIPTGWAETALADTTPGGDFASLVGGNSSAVTFTTTLDCIKPSARLFLGTACAPGSLSIAVSGSTLTDSNGDVLLAGATIGSLDYSNGIATWNSACPTYGAASKVVTFKPAATPLQVAQTSALAVTAENRGYVWVTTLAPIPPPGTLRVSFRANGSWYTLFDQGGGALKGVDSSYGSGSLTFATGTVTLTTGALPDVDSLIILTWGEAVNYTRRGGAAVTPPKVSGQAAHLPVAPSSFSVSWHDPNNVLRTLTDNGAGALTGSGGSGTLRYATGAWEIIPTLLPSAGTEFSANYQYGTPLSETKTGTVSGDGTTLTISLAHTDLTPGSVDVEFAFEYGTAILTDDGAGHLSGSGISATINYATGTLSLTRTQSVTTYYNNPVYEWVQVGTELQSYGTGYRTVPVFRQIQTGWNSGSTTSGITLVDASTSFTIHYRTADTEQDVTGEITSLTQLEIDLTTGYAQTIVLGSVRFRLGGSVYVDAAGQIYRDPSPDTGAGALSGNLDPSSGTVRLSAWTAGANAVTLESLVTALDRQVVDEVTFRTPASPLKAGTLQLRYTELDGTARSKTIGGTGILSDSDATITVDVEQGVVRARFGIWKVDADLSPSEKLEDWYDPDHRVDFAGVLKIWKPVLVLADSVIYNAVAQTFLPPDSNLLGLNAARMPPNGEALVYSVGRLVLVHHTAYITESSLSPTQVIDCGRVRLYRVAIRDSAEKLLSTDQYTLDRAGGTVTMSPTLDLTGLTAPYTIEHTVADLARIIATDINGTITINKALSHAYPADEAMASSVLYIGTLQARVTNLFAQSTWTGVWSDELIGSAPLAQYNDAAYPVVVTNHRAYPDRFLIRFTSATTFQVIGENLGVIATGDIYDDCSPDNSLTGQPYFTIRHQGWGTGWATGNCVRFNLVGACYPVDAIRATQPSEPSGSGPDRVDLLLLGNIDA